MNPRRIIAIGATAVTLTIASASVHAQSGAYARASLARPTALTVAGGTYNYDYLSDRSFPFGAFRVSRDYGRFLVVEGGVQAVRLSAVTRTAPGATTFSRGTFPQTTLDGTLQLQLPVSLFAPYAGVGVGYYYLAGGRGIRADKGLSRVGLVGVRFSLSHRALIRLEMRGRSDQHRGGNATDVEMGGGLGLRF